MKIKLMSKNFSAALFVLGGALLASQNVLAEDSAQDQSAERSPYWVNVGVGYVNFNSSASILSNGDTLPASATASSNTTLLAEFGYDITKNWAARLTVGIPPTTTLTGTGMPGISGATLGKVGYAPAVLSGTYSWDLGVVKPYLGAGVNYTIITSTQDGLIKGLGVGNGYGPVLQAGFNVPITKTWDWYTDFKQIFLKVNATGSALGAPASATVTLNPQVWSTGVTYHF